MSQYDRELRKFPLEWGVRGETIEWRVDLGLDWPTAGMRVPALRIYDEQTSLYREQSGPQRGQVGCAKPCQDGNGVRCRRQKRGPQKGEEGW